MICGSWSSRGPGTLTQRSLRLKGELSILMDFRSDRMPLVLMLTQHRPDCSCSKVHKEHIIRTICVSTTSSLVYPGQL